MRVSGGVLHRAPRRARRQLQAASGSLRPGASRRNAPRSDHIVSGRVRRDHPVGVADEGLGVPLDEMDEGDVRHTAASVKVSDAAHPKASHSRSCDSTDRLHLPRRDLIGVDVELLRQMGQCSIALDGGKCHLGL